MPPHETESADAPPRLLAMREIAAIIAGTILATVWLNLSSRGSETRFEDLALGEGTSTFYAAIGGACFQNPVACWNA